MPKVVDLDHVCHAQGCRTPVPPSLFMCPKHWKRLPKEHRDAIWRTYQRGQEITKTPSAAYLDAAKAAVEWMAKHEGVQLSLGGIV